MKLFFLILSLLICLLLAACGEIKSPSDPSNTNGSETGVSTPADDTTKYENGVPTAPQEPTLPADFPEITLPYLEFDDDYHEQGSFGPASTSPELEDDSSDDQPVSSPETGNANDHGTDDLPLDEWD